MQDFIILINIDLDDTAIDTNPVMRKIMIENGAVLNENDHWITMSDHGAIGEKVIREAKFMRVAGPRPGWGALPVWIKSMQQRYPGVVRFQYLTHRGYHPLGEQYSKLALRRDGMDTIPLKCICPNKHPSKAQWLLKNHAHGVQHILVDDFNKLSQLPKHPKVLAIVADQPWNQQITGLPRFTSFREFTEICEKMVANLLR